MTSRMTKITTCVAALAVTARDRRAGGLRRAVGARRPVFA